MTRQETTYRAAMEGTAVAHRLFRTELDVETKDSEMDFVTRADTDTQHRVIENQTVAPALGDVYAAGSDGATLNGEQISVSEETDLGRFIVAPILRYGSERDQEFGELLRELIGQFGDLLRFGCAQVTLGMVASGTIEAAVSTQPEPNPWDTIAGVHLIKQAGGTVTDIDGARWTPDAEGIVASNGTCHDVVVEYVARTIR